MNYFSKVLGICTMVIFLTACNSDNSVECIEYTGALEAIETPLVGTWKMTAIVSDQEVDITDDSTDNAIMDIYAQYTYCQKDAEYVFASDRGYTFKQGVMATNCLQEINNSGTWKFSNGIVQLASSCTQFSIDIALNADETVFIIESNVNIIDINNISVPAKLTVTYTRI